MCPTITSQRIIDFDDGASGGGTAGASRGSTERPANFESTLRVVDAGDEARPTIPQVLPDGED